MFAFCVRTAAIAIFLLAAMGIGVSAPANAHHAGSGQTGAGYYTSLKVKGQDTVQLYATERGHGRPILLLHGLGAHSYTWRRLIPVLARTNRVIALDLKGFGRSQKPFDRAYTPGDHARLVEAFIRKRGLRNLTIIGHSYGGAIALITTLRFNKRDPRRIRNLVLIAAPAYRQPNTHFVDFLRAPIAPYLAFTLVPPEVATWLSLNEAEARVTTQADIEAYARPYYEPGARHALITTSRQIVPSDIRYITSLYPTIRQQAMIVWCDGDPTVPISKGRRLAKTMPHAKMRIFKGCGHAIPDERPRQLARAVTQFLQGR